ncbi:hypothetical protein [Flavobacterium sp. J27]|uniref:hypothetical protein n=1 Tax=Flavobacterium sp. J27 TaxID=2060419 RepID=UPI001031FB6F|nr:hypothetical protein [Flavobacterium sp. J27]
MKTTILKLWSLILVISLFSCSPEDGKDGINGVDGADGTTGPQGPAGTANVIYSNWIPANFSGSSTSIKYMGIDFPASMPSASSIKNTHTLLVYFTGYGDGNVYQLPVLDFRGAQFTAGFGSASISASDINITAKAISGSLNDQQISPSLGAKFRYVLIPGGVLANKKGTNDYTKMNYEAICDFFNIPN